MTTKFPDLKMVITLLSCIQTNLKFWESTSIIKPHLSGNVGVPNSKRSHFMVTIEKKREWCATPAVIDEIIREFQEI